MEPKKYRVLKDIPGAKTGTIIEWDEANRIHWVSQSGRLPLPLNQSDMEAYPDFFEPVKDEQSVWPKVGDRVYAINVESFEPGEFIFDRNDAKFFKNPICWNHFKTAAHRDGAIELIKKYRKDLGYE